MGIRCFLFNLFRYVELLGYPHLWKSLCVTFTA